MIAYTPVDLKIELPSEEDLYNYCITNTFSKKPKVENGIISVVGTKIDIKDWRTTLDAYEGRIYDEDTKDEWEIQYEKLHNATNSTDQLGEFYFDPRFKEMFPSLVEACLSLPFKYLTGVFFLLAGHKGTPIHKDPPPMSADPTQQTSIVPNRYNISLNCFDNPKFFIQNDKEKIYMKVTKEYPCFAFDNENYLHGADVADETSMRRMQLLIYGVLDDTKHQELLNKSIAKFYG